MERLCQYSLTIDGARATLAGSTESCDWGNQPTIPLSGDLVPAAVEVEAVFINSPAAGGTIKLTYGKVL